MGSKRSQTKAKSKHKSLYLEVCIDTSTSHWFWSIFVYRVGHPTLLSLSLKTVLHALDFVTLASFLKFRSYLFATKMECLIYLKFSLCFMLVFITTSLPVKEYALKNHV